MIGIKVKDCITNKYINISDAFRVVVSIQDSCILYGYTKDSKSVIKAIVLTKEDAIIRTIIKGNHNIIFSNIHGCYMVSDNMSEQSILEHTKAKGRGNFPYSFAREYEAVNNFKLFEGKQKLQSKRVTKFIDEKTFPYTFGLEFETSCGYIPEDVCFSDGLIPLRDGSISGIEYSTIVLKGNKGLNLLKQQLEHLKQYTLFNKECSLHVHVGGFKLTPDVIFRVYKICRLIEPELESILPQYTFKTSMYKQTGKDYCKKLRSYSSFEDMYTALTGTQFFGDLFQAHPNDIKRRAKWNVSARYYFVNFVNAICYNVNKTIEFRFLRPTYSFEKIYLWILIFFGIIKYAESSKQCSEYSIISYMEQVYPKDIVSIISSGLAKVSIVTKNQYMSGDLCGECIEAEKDLFPW